MTGDDEDDAWEVWDWQPCRCRIEGAAFDRVVGLEISGVYDGVLFWRCSACGRSFQRWPEGHGLHERAQPFIDTWNRMDEHIARFGPGVTNSDFTDLNPFAEYGDRAGDETFGVRRLAYEELHPDDEDGAKIEGQDDGEDDGDNGDLDGNEP